MEGGVVEAERGGPGRDDVGVDGFTRAVEPVVANEAEVADAEGEFMVVVEDVVLEFAKDDEIDRRDSVGRWVLDSPAGEKLGELGVYCGGTNRVSRIPEAQVSERLPNGGGHLLNCISLDPPAGGDGAVAVGLAESEE